ncbi:hypothetical protein QJQ45_002958 [Haematococcus lacustris]|nr:hypothetical protein QJQ45_002958 [Haematococcus lacustris]
MASGVTNVWFQQPGLDGLAPGSRGGHASVSVGSKVIVFGGSDRAPVTYNDLWVLDTGRWCQVQPRSGASLAAIGNTVYLFGGQEPLTEFRFGDLKQLDTLSWSWSNTQLASSAPAPPARHSHTLCSFADHGLLLYGGSGYTGTLSDAWLFNPGDKAWRRVEVTGSSPAPREMHSAVMVAPSRMLVYGGRTSDGRVLCDAAVLDVSAGRWLAQEPTPFTRCAHASVMLPANNSVLVFGGFSGESVLGDVLSIHPQSLEVEVMHGGRLGMAPAVGADKELTPAPRFAHTAVAVPWPPASKALPSPDQRMAMLVFGGVSPGEDLQDVAVWLPGNSSAAGT